VPITYLKGDATSPQAKGAKVIAHICNDIGKWGAGFVMAVSKKWPSTRADYLDWANRNVEYPRGVERGAKLALGRVQYLQVKSDHLGQPDIIVANMIAQAGTKTGSKGPPIRYEALEKCLMDVAKNAKTWGASVHMPRIGTGLAQGSWQVIEPIILKVLADTPVYVYDYER
jgi:O-acetyl-ADP-ribose deacetylase (regulator of RNase III)